MKTGIKSKKKTRMTGVDFSCTKMVNDQTASGWVPKCNCFPDFNVCSRWLALEASLTATNEPYGCSIFPPIPTVVAVRGKGKWERGN